MGLVIIGVLASGMAAAGGHAAWLAFAVVLGLSAVQRGRSRSVRTRFLLVGLTVVVAMTIGLAMDLTLAISSRRRQLLHPLAMPRSEPHCRVESGRACDHDDPLFGVARKASIMLSGTSRHRKSNQPCSERSWVQTKTGFLHHRGNVVVLTPPGADGPKAFRLDWDKAHNYFLDMALATGLPSAVTLALVMATTLLVLYRSRDHFDRNVAWALLAYVIFAQAWFYSVSLDPIVSALRGRRRDVRFQEHRTNRGSAPQSESSLDPIPRAWIGQSFVCRPSDAVAHFDLHARPGSRSTVSRHNVGERARVGHVLLGVVG